MTNSNAKRELYELCDMTIRRKVPIEETINTIRNKIEEHGESLTSHLFDVITSLSSSPIEKNDDTAKQFFKVVSTEFLPGEILKLELPQLEADAFKHKIIKAKTKLYYKQLKFNLFREESEGYAKLITELLSIKADDDCAAIFDCISQLIGQFNLDPNRVVDLLLDCFACNFQSHKVFISVLRMFNIETDVLKRIVLLKLILLDKAAYTPNSIYRVVAMLCAVKMLNIMEIFQVVSPSREKFAEHLKEQRKVLTQRISKAETISTLATIQSEDSKSNGLNSLNDNIYSSSSAAPTRSFSSVLNAQEIEDQKLSSDVFKESYVLSTNQKFGLLVASAEIGSLSLVQQLIRLFPESYPLGTSKRLAIALCDILEYIIDPFYNLMYQAIWQDEPMRIKNWDNMLVDRPERLGKWEDLSSRVMPLLNILGPYLGVNREVGIKLIRTLNLFFSDTKVMTTENYSELTNTIFHIVDFCLLPSLSIGEPSFSYNEELWTILSRIPYQHRYWMYGRWKNVHSVDNYGLQLQRGKVMGQMKYIMKRMTKETVKVAGRQLGKVCLKHPTIALDYMLERIQNFYNLIEPVVNAMKYLSPISFDVLAYSLIESLAQPSKQGLKTSDGTLSAWLVSLATFTGAVYRRYNVEYEGILQYVTNQLKDGKSIDLMVLREVITATAGFEPTNSLTNDQLYALCSGETLRQEVIGNNSQKGRRQAILRLRDALLHNDLCESLAILLAQQKNCVIYHETKDAPVKLTSQMVDQCQETFLQYSNFLRFNVKSEEYKNRIPSITSLLTDFHLPPESAFFLARPNYNSKSLSIYDAMKKAEKEKSETKKVEAEKKNELYVEALTQVMNSLEEELCKCIPDKFFTDLSAKVYTFFWLLSVNDIQVSSDLYKREIERVGKEIADLSKLDLSKSRKLREKERLKALEQKLSQELNRQTEHVTRVRTLLTKYKEELFAKPSISTISLMSKFIQYCLIPRCVFSEVDAVYCAKFVNLLHSIRTGFFSTIVFLDLIFKNIIQTLSSLSENEASSFGKFLSLLLDMVLRWHSKKEIFDEECAGYPGCLTRLRNSNESFTYDSYHTVCQKWQIRLSRTLNEALGERSSYSVIRNTFLLLNKILNQFPLIEIHTNEIEKNVLAVRDREKEKRMDLSVMAQSYLVHLKKRSVTYNLTF